MAGPSARATLMPRLDSEIADCRSRLSTTSGVKADQAGIINAVPMPMPSVSSSNSITLMSPLRVSSASVIATVAIHSWTPSR